MLCIYHLHPHPMFLLVHLLHHLQIHFHLQGSSQPDWRWFMLLWHWTQFDWVNSSNRQSGKLRFGFGSSCHLYTYLLFDFYGLCVLKSFKLDSDTLYFQNDINFNGTIVIFIPCFDNNFYYISAQIIYVY